MAQTLAMTAMSGAQFALWLLVGLLFWKRKFSRRFPNTTRYLLLKILSAPALYLLALESATGRGNLSDLAAVSHLFLYWSVYLAGAILLFFICIEIFRSALVAYPALMKFGIVIVRWVALVSVIVSLASMPFMHRKVLILSDVALGFMWAVSVVELCLLAFLCLGMNALRLTTRDFPFGLAIGFGLISAGDLVGAAFREGADTLSTPVYLVQGMLVLAALVLWTIYCLLPERERRPVAESASSTVYRWNEIANALGHNGTRVTVPARQGDGFFLADVERVVDKVLNRNLKNNESGS